MVFVRFTVLPMNIRFLVLCIVPAVALLACSESDVSESGRPGAEFVITEEDLSADSESDTDTDTDADSDTDTDPDTDTDADTDTGETPEPWDADTITVDASFGYDETTGELLAIVEGTTTHDPVISFRFFNLDDSLTSRPPTQHCVVSWDVKGVPTWAPEFEPPFWLSVDLVGLPMTFDDGDFGNCEGMSIFGDARGAKESLEDFIDSQDLAYGIDPLSDVPPTVIEGWRSTWERRHGARSWSSDEDYMAAGAFSSSLTEWEPYYAHLMLAYEVDSSTWTCGRARLDVSKATTLRTGFYESAPF